MPFLFQTTTVSKPDNTRVNIENSSLPHINAIFDYLSKTKDIGADLRLILEGYYAPRSGLTGEVKRQINDICAWLSSNHESLIRDLKNDLLSGRFQIGDYYHSHLVASLGFWLGQRYLFYKEGFGEGTILPIAVAGGGGARYETPDNPGNAHIYSGKIKGLSEVDLFVALFNIAIHEQAHAFRFSIGKKGTVTELGTYLAQSRYGLPMSLEAGALFFGKRNVPHTISQAVDTNMSPEKILKYLTREYGAFLIGPYIEAYYEKKGKAPRFYEFYADNYNSSSPDLGLHDEALAGEISKAYHHAFKKTPVLSIKPISDKELFRALELYLGKPKKKDIPDGFVIQERRGGNEFFS
ncbi:MAG: hypothetical protein WC588_00535 [Candidatus Micrarchaeia archaeon]